MLACALVVSRVAVAAVTEYATRNPSMSPAVGVARVTVRLLVGALAIITALETLGVPVAPLVTTLGVGSLAVALALQETLANFFAGLYLLADRPVRAGDYIKINDAQGEEGYVESIGWRSSRLRTLKNNTVIVPNQKLSQAILTNFHLPARAGGDGGQPRRAAAAEPTAVEACLNDELTRAAAELPSLITGKPVALLADVTDAGQVWSSGLPGRRRRGTRPRRTRASQASAGTAAARGNRAGSPDTPDPRRLLQRGRDGERREIRAPVASSTPPASVDPKR